MLVAAGTMIISTILIGFFQIRGRMVMFIIENSFLSNEPLNQIMYLCI